jgi:hypothetical protein
VKACVGADPAKCFDYCWERVHESEKWWIRGAIKARAAGLGVEAAMKEANELAMRYVNDQAAQERAATAAPAAPQVAQEPSVPEPPMPQVRLL